MTKLLPSLMTRSKMKILVVGRTLRTARKRGSHIASLRPLGTKVQSPSLNPTNMMITAIKTTVMMADLALGQATVVKTETQKTQTAAKIAEARAKAAWPEKTRERQTKTSAERRKQKSK